MTENDHDNVDENVLRFPVIMRDSVDMRLLDLALAYAVDNPAIHFNQDDRRNRLERMLKRLLQWFADDGSEDTTSA